MSPSPPVFSHEDLSLWEHLSLPANLSAVGPGADHQMLGLLPLLGPHTWGRSCAAGAQARVRDEGLSAQVAGAPTGTGSVRGRSVTEAGGVPGFRCRGGASLSAHSCLVLLLTLWPWPPHGHHMRHDVAVVL